MIFRKPMIHPMCGTPHIAMESRLLNFPKPHTSPCGGSREAPRRALEVTAPISWVCPHGGQSQRNVYNMSIKCWLCINARYINVSKCL